MNKKAELGHHGNNILNVWKMHRPVRLDEEQDEHFIRIFIFALFKIRIFNLLQLLYIYSKIAISVKKTLVAYCQCEVELKDLSA